MHKSNHCFLIGNLGADPVERGRSEKAGPIVGFPIAENVRAFDREANEYKTVHTNWFQVTAFGSLAERIKTGLKRGDRIAVQGQIKSSRYTDKSGEERTGFEIIAEDVALWQPLASAGGRDAQEDATPPSLRRRERESGAQNARRGRTAGYPSRDGGRDADEALPF